MSDQRDVLLPREIDLYGYMPSDELTLEFIKQLAYYGYHLTLFASIDKLLQAQQQKPAFSILVDYDFAVEQNQLGKLQANISPLNIPLVFLSKENDVDTRLQIVRLNGKIFFAKPLVCLKLVHKLDEIGRKIVAAAYKILIVEDSKSLAQYYAAILKEAKMVTEILSDFKELNNIMQRFLPDLVLMDLYMPKCSGLELASILRQQEEFASIPIVFLSSEENRDKQLAAMTLGGDDFLTKPIEPTHLIASVKNRAERYRLLHGLMVRDSLTELYNHTSIQQILSESIEFAKFHNLPLAFAMIDLDYFKTINDTYGHNVGDQVLMSIANMLEARLRKTDFIGRYGGEEFAVIFPKTTAKQAEQIISQVLDSFSKIQHRAKSKVFSVTFSAGIAEIPPYCSYTELNKKADDALYQAKKAGRNCVRIKQ